jgi:hypothetical protein
MIQFLVKEFVDAVFCVCGRVTDPSHHVCWRKHTMTLESREHFIREIAVQGYLI